MHSHSDSDRASEMTSAREKGRAELLTLPPEVTYVTPIPVMLVETNHAAVLTFRGQGKWNHPTFPQETPDSLRTGQ